MLSLKRQKFTPFVVPREDKNTLHTVLSTLAGAHGIGQGILGFFTPEEGVILRLICTEFREAVEQSTWNYSSGEDVVDEDGGAIVNFYNPHAPCNWSNFYPWDSAFPIADHAKLVLVIMRRLGFNIDAFAGDASRLHSDEEEDAPGASFFDVDFSVLADMSLQDFKNRRLLIEWATLPVQRLAENYRNSTESWQYG